MLVFFGNAPQEAVSILLGANYSDGLVSLFNGILTFVGYLMPKPFSEKEQ